MTFHAQSHIGARAPALLTGLLCLGVMTGGTATQVIAGVTRGQDGAVPAFVDPRAGDCTVVVRHQNTIDPDKLVIEINATRVTARVGPTNPAVFELLEPLRYLDRLTGTSDSVSFAADVGPRRGGSHPRTSCHEDQPDDTWDERGVFEAAGFFGIVTDNFAPVETLGYVNQVAGANLTRRSIGLETRYLFWKGQKGKRFWVTANVLQGVRSADIDCNETPAVIGCGGADLQEDFLFILQHATTMEAHFAPRFEFATLNRDSIAPMQLFVGGHSGFIAVRGGPQILQNHDIGVGGVVAGGPFRDTSVYWGVGLTQLYKTDPGFNRLKVRGRLVFDLAPTWKERAQFWKRSVASWRFFIDTIVDQSVADGPDGVQTYVGFLYDFRTTFRPF